MQLTKEQRYTIQSLKQLNYSNIEIARVINVHKSTIGRELKRNNKDGSYCYINAQNQCDNRHQIKPKRILFTEVIRQQIDFYIKEDYSPEQITGRMRLECKQTVSHETIYKYIWSDKELGGVLYSHLRTKKKKYSKRGTTKKKEIIKNRVPISERPSIVDKKERFGDLEIDTVVGKDKLNYLLTINDRATRMCWAYQLNTKDSHLVAKKTTEILAPFKNLLHTITSDNGTEFTQHESIAKALEVDFYFARPYHSSDRGANENTNGLIRQYYLKQSNFTEYNNQYLSEILEKINNRPRKCLGFLSPNEVFKKLNLRI